MCENKLHFTLGGNIGKIMLDIAQENILKGNPTRALELYTQSFPGMTNEMAISILKNEMVLEVAPDEVSVLVTDDEDTLEENVVNIYKWDKICDTKIDSLNAIVKYIYELENNSMKHYHGKLNDINLYEVCDRANHPHDIGNLAAKLIAHGEFPNCRGNGEATWNKLVDRVENGEAEHCEYVMFYVVEYVNNIKNLHETYMSFANMYSWLVENKFIEHIPFVESNLENVLFLLNEFTDPNTGYYNAMCDEEVYNLKEKIEDDLLTTSYGNEYLKYGILLKNIMDGYDAGWLSPEGEFYGANGQTSSMIHLRIAEALFADKYHDRMIADGVAKYSSNSPEEWLTHKGWIKIHHNDVYGYFNPNVEGYASDPTEIQIDMICNYIDKHYDHKLYAQPHYLSDVKPITTYKIQKMDKFQLRKVFEL